MPINAGAMISFTFFTAFKTPLPMYVHPPSRNSKASKEPVDAPDGTAARPNAPPDNSISHSIVGLPRLSIICRACILVMFNIIFSPFYY